MNVSLKPELERFVEDQVKAGHYATADELIEASLARLMLDGEDEFLDEETMAAIDRAEAEFDRGEGMFVDEAFAQLRKKHLGK